MLVPTEIPNANTISQTDVDAQRNLMRECEQKSAELLEQHKLTKLCSDTGFLKNIGNGQFFITLDEEGPDDMKTLCREFVRGDTKIGPVLDVKVYFHQGRYCVDMVRTVNGINKNVTETSEEMSIESVEHGCTGKLVAKAEPRPKLTSINIVSCFFSFS